MELKLRTRDVLRVLRSCSNRTFMELKYRDFREIGVAFLVLIVPLWN